MDTKETLAHLEQTAKTFLENLEKLKAKLLEIQKGVNEAVEMMGK